MSAKSRKIVLIGAGSLFFGRQAIWALTNQPGFRNATLVLVDLDTKILDKMARLARLAAGSSSSGIRVEATTDFRAALPGADFVILSFAANNTHYRRIDCRVSAKYGIRMCSGDTIGPGGVFRALREFPRILEIAKAMGELCPEAWLVNYVNPSAVIGIGLMRHAPVRSLALCDTHHMPAKHDSYAEMLGLSADERKRFRPRIAGVNHFTWMLEAEMDGRDLMPDLREIFRANGRTERDEGYAKARFNNTITAQLTDVFGALPTCTGHTKEYLPYYQGRPALAEPVPPLAVFDCDEREERKAKMWTEIDAYLDGTKPMAEFHASGRSDHATDVIHTMIVEDGRTYYINRSNADAAGGGCPVANLPADAFLELHCALDRNGPRPFPVGSFPFGLRALQMLVLDIHELTIEAIVKQDRSLLVRALAIDPLVNSIATAEAVIAEIHQAEEEALPTWLAGRTNPLPVPSLVIRERATPQLY